MASTKPSPPDLLLIVFIHGFKGSNGTFHSFPGRVERQLATLVDNVESECITYPAYETRGELAKAVEAFSNWLKELVTNRKQDRKGEVKVVLCGHSMGGLVAADAVLHFVKERPDRRAPLFPRVIACLSYDTPYLGLNSKIVYLPVAGLIGAAEKSVSAIKSVPMVGRTAGKAMGSVMETGLKIGGATTRGAAQMMIGASKILPSRSLTPMGKWVSDHLEFVGVLFEGKALEMRLERMVEYGLETGFVFRTFFTQLRENSKMSIHLRTFIDLPSSHGAIATYFLKALNNSAKDELGAHRGMFKDETNDGYDWLVSKTTKLIKSAVMSTRGEALPVPKKVYYESPPDEVPTPVA